VFLNRKLNTVHHTPRDRIWSISLALVKLDAWRRIQQMQRRLAMSIQMTLSDAELELILNLVERERSELPVEIRHTRTAKVREELHARREVVRVLLERLRSPVAV
jgi:hypothetical protein